MAQIDRINALVGQMGIKAPCACATVGAVQLVGEQIIDGVQTALSRVLVLNQADQTTNGIYLSNLLAWTREPDFDGPNDVMQGTLVPVAQGTANADSIWQLTTANVVVIGTSLLTFTLMMLSAAQTAAATAAGTAAVTANSAIKVASVAAMEALPIPAADANFILQGYVTAGDGGQGIFFWNATDATAANGGTVIACTANGANAGRFNKLL